MSLGIPYSLQLITMHVRSGRLLYAALHRGCKAATQLFSLELVHLYRNLHWQQWEITRLSPKSTPVNKTGQIGNVILNQTPKTSGLNFIKILFARGIAIQLRPDYCW